MLRIIKSTIETLRADGYNCGLKIGTKWVTAQNMDVQYPLFVVDPLQYKENAYDFSKDYTIYIAIGYSNENQDEQDEVMNIETVEYCETVKQKFLIVLTNYVNSDSQRTITITQDLDAKQFHDDQIWNDTMSGVYLTLYVHKIQTNQC